MHHRVYGAPVGAITYFVALLASMGGFLFGWDTGQIADLTIMTDYVNRFAQTNAQGEKEWNSWILGLVVGLLSIGAIFGSFCGSPVAERYGRRMGIVTGCIVFLVGIIIQVASQTSWVQMGIGRLITGVAVGWLSASVPVYQSETVRGALVGTYQLFITIGILLSYVTCYGTRNYTTSAGLPSTAQWRVPIGLGFAWALILIIGILFCPESPRWLARKGRYDEARRTLSIMRGVGPDDLFVANEFYEIKQETAEELKHADRGWLACFSPHEMALYRTLLGIFLQMGQQLTGANYFFYYGATIFKSVGLKGERGSYITQIILGAVNTGTTFPGLWAMDRFGRRTVLLVGAAWMMLWLIVFATAGTAGNSETSSIGTLMIVSACLYILAFASTWGPGVWTCIAEFSVPETRTKQFALATSSNWIWNFCIGFFTPPITDNIQFKYGYVFVGCLAMNFVVVYFFLYESANLTLESVNAMYLDDAVRPWNSAKWIPPGYSDRREVSDVVKKDIREAGLAGMVPDPDAPSKDTDNVRVDHGDLA
ncbi:hypothetical protein MSPP1_000112 [Malassezia sp. CBS 17886]|nr:hypothetical protein MSPP1_000112 [Malassezia sp. CBS 17886]